MEPARLLYYRLTGVQIRRLTRRCAAAVAHLPSFPAGNVRPYHLATRRTGDTGGPPPR